MSTFGGDVMWYARGGGTNAAIASNIVDEAEARGAPASVVKSWRDQLVEMGVDGSQDIDGINALAGDASEWSAAGNAGQLDTQAGEYVDKKKAELEQAAADLASKAGDAGAEAVAQVKPLLIAGGVIVLGLIVLAIVVRR